MKISDIQVASRFRRNLGNLDEMIDSINTNGLLCPITITRENLLIDGLRRMEAYRQLSIEDIPVHIVDIPIRENGEIDANLIRKDFTVEELLAIKKYRESIEPNLQGKRTDLASGTNVSHQLRGKFPRGSTEKRRQERIAENTGLSYKSLARLEEVARMGKKHPQLGDLIRKIDSRKMKINQAWKMVNRYNTREQTLAQAKKLKINLPDGLELFQGDCRHKIDEVDDNSIDLIFTDPPYDRGSLSLYIDPGKIAARVLKPGGSLVAYVPHHSIQVWTFCVKHTGHLARIASIHLRVNWKPLLWLVKGESQPNVIPDANFDDFVISTPPDKSLHEWTQSLTESEYIIKNLTVENQVILDCFMGIGTTGIAAISNKRRFIGIEIDKTSKHSRSRGQRSLLAVPTPPSLYL